MSFSSELKEELSKKNNLANKEEVKWELIGYLISNNTTCYKTKIKYTTENEYNINRFSKLLSNVNQLDYQIGLTGKVYWIECKKIDLPEIEYEEDSISYQQKDLAENLIKAFLRGIFLGSGSMNNPEKKYHLELLFSKEETAKQIQQLMQSVSISFKWLERPETPVFIGGMTQYIEFDEVISKSATETAYGNQPLGDIAAIGRGGKPTNSGHIHYQCEEPGYIMGLMAITPMIDYSQGNDFDLNLQTIDDLHKPALDGIGYQDLIQEQMVGETSVYSNGATISNLNHLSANKTLAWIDYMTNYNRTFGDFAAGEALDFMVLNRRYDVQNNQIKDLTTYIDPQKYIEIFADTSIDSQNFWVQTVVNATRRGNYSAKQIPFL